MHLENCGYHLFHIGIDCWLAISSEFFIETDDNFAMDNEGYGPCVQGNVLALHSKYARHVVTKILENLRVIANMTMGR